MSSLDHETLPRLANADVAVVASEAFVLCHLMLLIPLSKIWWSVYNAHTALVQKHVLLPY